jgi:protein gp37
MHRVSKVVHLRLPQYPEMSPASECSWRSPKRVFVNSMSDLFHENVSYEQRDRIFSVMFFAGQHIFQVLTKRPDAMLEYFSADNPRYTARKIADAAYEMEIRDHCFDCDIYFPFPNVWLGVSVENQAAAHKRIPMLLKTPAAARFISAEPLLGSVDLTEIWDRDEDVDCLWNSLAPYHEFLNSDSMDIVAAAVDGVTKLDWVICGGESGPGARPMHPDWARSPRDQ